MTCHEIRDLLPLHLYGDLAAEQRAAVDAHLQECANCRAEFAAVAAVRNGLDAAVVPAPAVDLAALYRAEGDRLRRRARRWRVAAAAAAVAALLLLVPRLDVRLDGRQFSVRWSQTERDVSALYTAQFGSRQSGVNP